MAVNKAKFLDLTGQDPPSDAVEFIKQNKLKHGDVVQFGEYRCEDAYVVKNMDDGLLGWVKNPNTFDTEHLAITPDTTDGKIKNVRSFYSEILKQLPEVNIVVNKDDQFVAEKFGAVPKEWWFDLHHEDGVLSDVSIQLDRGRDWHDLGDMKKFNRDTLKEYYHK